MRPVDFKDEFYSRNPLNSNNDLYDVVSSLPCERVNRLDNNRCINCGVKAGSECAR
jgi:hypothetical protein